MEWEYLGYGASALLVLSLMMEDVKRLRWFNFSGCVAFAIYGVAIEAWPVAFTNGLLAIINVYHLNKLRRQAQTQAAQPK